MFSDQNLVNVSDICFSVWGWGKGRRNEASGGWFIETRKGVKEVGVGGGAGLEGVGGARFCRALNFLPREYVMIYL